MATYFFSLLLLGSIPRVSGNWATCPSDSEICACINVYIFYALLCGFDMAPQIPGTGVFSLESSLGHSTIPRESWLDPLELGGVQSCFALPGSVGEARNLHRRGRTRAVHRGHGPFFIHSSLSDFTQHNPSLTGVYAATQVAGTSSGHVASGISDHAALGHGWEVPDTHQSVFPAAIDGR